MMFVIRKLSQTDLEVIKGGIGTHPGEPPFPPPPDGQNIAYQLN